MGGNRSKPVTETARSVLVRKGIIDAANPIPKIPITPPVPPQFVPSNASSNEHPIGSHEPPSAVSEEPKPEENLDLDADILKEISKWSFVRHSTTPPKQMVIKGEPSAAIIRLNEIKERESLTPSELKAKNVGRLSEADAMELLTKLRQDSSTENITKLAIHYRVSTLNIDILSRFVKAPIVDSQRNDEDYPIAR